MYPSLLPGIHKEQHPERVASNLVRKAPTHPRPRYGWVPAAERAASEQLDNAGDQRADHRARNDHTLADQRGLTGRNRRPRAYGDNRSCRSGTSKGYNMDTPRCPPHPAPFSVGRGMGAVTRSRRHEVGVNDYRRLPTGARECLRPPTVPAPTPAEHSPIVRAWCGLYPARSLLIIANRSRPSLISIAATSEHTWKTAACMTAGSEPISRNHRPGSGAGRVGWLSTRYPRRTNQSVDLRALARAHGNSRRRHRRTFGFMRTLSAHALILQPPATATECTSDEQHSARQPARARPSRATLCPTPVQPRPTTMDFSSSRRRRHRYRPPGTAPIRDLSAHLTTSLPGQLIPHRPSSE
jgi:hypothetical protein